MIRRRWVVRGRVQGVGFRYHTAEHARGRAITGSVRNQRDGSVAIEAQGELAELDAFFAAVTASPPGRIDHRESAEVPAVEGEAGFRVRF